MLCCQGRPHVGLGRPRPAASRRRQLELVNCRKRASTAAAAAAQQCCYDAARSLVLALRLLCLLLLLLKEFWLLAPDAAGTAATGRDVGHCTSCCSILQPLALPIGVVWRQLLLLLLLLHLAVWALVGPIPAA
jgi:hypothetical protein